MPNERQKELLKLEKERKRLLNSGKNSFYLSMLFLFLLIIISFVFLENKSIWEKLLFLGGGVFALYLLSSTSINFKVGGNRTEFLSRFKQFYLKPYCESYGYNYTHLAHINAVDIILSGLFPSFTHQEGDDMVSGVKNGVKFSFSDIVLKDEEKEDDDSISRMILRSNSSHLGSMLLKEKSKTTILFKGILFIADFNKTFNSKVFIFQNRTPNDSLKRIDMDNEFFNTTFKVYGSDIQSVFYVLSPALMERIENLSRHFNCPINISFSKGKIYIAIDTGVNSFEPDISKSLITSNVAKGLIAELNLLLSIVDILALDSNLWAKIK